MSTRAIMVDDTKLVSEVLKDVLEQVGPSFSIPEDDLSKMHDDECTLFFYSLFIFLFTFYSLFSIFIHF